MAMNKAQREAVAKDVAHLASIAAMRDIDTAVYTLEIVCRQLGVKPESLSDYNDLKRSLNMMNGMDK